MTFERMNLRSLSPVSTYKRSIDNFFNDRYRALLDMNREFSPALNAREDEAAYLVELAVPGVRKDDLDIYVHDGVMTVLYDHKENAKEKDNGYIAREFNRLSFRRAFNLPEDVDEQGIDAKYEDGVLEIKLPRKEASEKEHPMQRIPVE